MPSLLVIVSSLALQMLPSRYSPFLPQNERDERLLLLLFIKFANRVQISYRRGIACQMVFASEPFVSILIMSPALLELRKMLNISLYINIDFM